MKVTRNSLKEINSVLPAGSLEAQIVLRSLLDSNRWRVTSIKTSIFVALVCVFSQPLPSRDADITKSSMSMSPVNSVQHVAEVRLDTLWHCCEGCLCAERGSDNPRNKRTILQHTAPTTSYRLVGGSRLSGCCALLQIYRTKSLWRGSLTASGKS